MWHGELSNLPWAVKTTVNGARPTTCEITNRQGKKFPTQEIEHCRIKAHCCKGDQIFLCKGGELHEDEHGEHPEQDRFQQTDVVFDNDLIHDQLCEDGKEQLKKGDGDSQSHDLQQDDFKAREEWKNPLQRWFAFRGLF